MTRVRQARASASSGPGCTTQVAASRRGSLTSRCARVLRTITSRRSPRSFSRRLASASASMCPKSRRNWASVLSNPGFRRRMRLYNSVRSLPTGVALRSRRKRFLRSLTSWHEPAHPILLERQARLDGLAEADFIGEEHAPAKVAQDASNGFQLVPEVREVCGGPRRQQFVEPFLQPELGVAVPQQYLAHRRKI